MSVLYIAIPVALVIALVAVIAFVLQVRNGQYDDLETPAHRMLFDDVDQADEPEKRSETTDQ
jgi:cbb3-type cytochrome oxidase maturation protein